MLKKLGSGQPTAINREIDPEYLRRAEGIDPRQVPEHLESIAISLHQALDAWRYHNSGTEDVTLCIDAFVALWSVVEQRDTIDSV